MLVKAEIFRDNADGGLLWGFLPIKHIYMYITEGKM